MKNILCFLYDGFVDFEIILACTEINLDENHQVTYIAYNKTPIKSSAGLKIIPDKTVAEISSIAEFDGLIIPGGFIRDLNPKLEQLIHKFNEKKKLIAAICGGPEFLAKAGILEGRKYACSMFPEYYAEKNEPDPFPRDTYIETRLIQDGNLITARGNAFVDFALEIWDWFDLFENENEKKECKTEFTPT